VGAVYLHAWVRKVIATEIRSWYPTQYLQRSANIAAKYSFFSVVLYVALLQLKYKPGGLHCMRQRLGCSTSLAALRSWWRVISVGLVSFSGYFPLICAFCCCKTNTQREMIHAIIRAVPYTMR